MDPVWVRRVGHEWHSLMAEVNAAVAVAGHGALSRGQSVCSPHRQAGRRHDERSCLADALAADTIGHAGGDTTVQ